MSEEIPLPFGSENGDGGRYGIHLNPYGPWANLGDQCTKNAILSLARETYDSRSKENTKLSSFADFLDVFASAWLEQKAKVESDAFKHGFIACNSTNIIPYDTREKVSLLMLTLSGSYLLLGNRCLSRSGGSGKYERIPVRKSALAVQYSAQSGIAVRGEGSVGLPICLTSYRPVEFIQQTSPLFALYYTTKILTPDNLLVISRAVSDSISNFTQTVRDDLEETVRELPENIPSKSDEVPEVEPMKT